MRISLLFFAFLYMTGVLQCQEVIRFYKTVAINAEKITAFNTDSLGNSYSALSFTSKYILIENDTGVYKDTLLYDNNLGIYKQNPDGSLAWIKFIKLNNYYSQNTSAFGIDIDRDQNVYISGLFNSTVDFDPSTNSTYLTANEAPLSDNPNDRAFFILKLDSRGNFVWVKKIDAASSYGYNLIVNKQQDIVVFGQFNGFADFDPNPNVIFNSDYSYNGTFILRLDTSGDFLGLKQLGNRVRTNDVVLTNNGDYLLIGYFGFPSDFDPDSTNIIYRPKNSHSDGFLAKYDRFGSLIWVNHLDLSLASQTTFLSIDPLDRAYVYGAGGIVGDTFDFQVGSNNPNSTHIFTERVPYLCRYSSNGQFESVSQITSPDFDGKPLSSTSASGGHYVTSWELYSGLHQSTHIRKVDNNSNILSRSIINTYNNRVWIEFMNYRKSSGSIIFSGNCSESFAALGDVDFIPGVFYLYAKDGEVGLKDLKEDQSIPTVYPNPASNQVHINGNDVESVEIYDISFKLVQRESKSSFTINSLKAGLYFVRINTKFGVRNAKLIKQ